MKSDIIDVDETAIKDKRDQEIMSVEAMGKFSNEG